jgi:hypothetical protein
MHGYAWFLPIVGLTSCQTPWQPPLFILWNRICFQFRVHDISTTFRLSISQARQARLPTILRREGELGGNFPFQKTRASSYGGSAFENIVSLK